MAKRLTDFQVLTFDCYGTLIDWETGIWNALQPLFRANERTDLERAEVLKIYAKHEHAHERAHPTMLYPEVLARTHRSVATELGFASSDELAAAFGSSVRDWPAFPDSEEALRYLKTRYRLVILSNVDHESFAASNRKLGVEFDAIYTAEDIGSYKPSAANFEYLLLHLETDLDLTPGDVLHTAQSLFHDHVPAKTVGLANAWIDRQRLSEGGNWGATMEADAVPETDFRFFSMAEMAEAVRAESA